MEKARDLGPLRAHMRLVEGVGRFQAYFERILPERTLQDCQHFFAQTRLCLCLLGTNELEPWSKAGRTPLFRILYRYSMHDSI